MRVIVLGANGGLGRNVVAAAVAAGHEVRAFARDPGKAGRPAAVEPWRGDARSRDALAAAMQGTDAAFFCVNPRFERWLGEFMPLARAAVEAAAATGTRLVFPGNVWVYGKGVPGEGIAEPHPFAPTSKRGALRLAMEELVRGSGIRYTIVRLPEFYGPHVVSLTARVFVAARADRLAIWPGRLDREIELVYMPDGAAAMVQAGCAPDSDGRTFHVPGGRTTARQFVGAVFAAAGRAPRLLAVPPALLAIAGLVHPLARGAADIAHLWTHPVLLDGAGYAARFGAVPRTPYATGIAETLAWLEGEPEIGLQG